MSTYTSEPGTRLAGRYRLVDTTSSGTGWTYWKATDETLARLVTVLTFAAGFPRVTEAVTAARAASRLNDSRFAQVFDVEDADEGAYVVLEWVAGESLADLLAEGPLDPPRAATIMVEAAQALAAAHRAGQAHLRLDPAGLHWTPGGGVKITGLGIDAALAGPALTESDGEDPELTDTRDLGRLLYAALTGYWPGPGTTALPPPPTESDGSICTPRQVAAGVPAGIDQVTCRASFQQENRQGPALTSPAEFADALAAVTPRGAAVPPVFGPRTAQAADYQAAGYQATAGTNPYPMSDTAARVANSGYRRRHPATERSAVARGLVSVVIVLVLAAVGVAAWAVSRSVHHAKPSSESVQRPSSSSPAAAAAVPLTPASAAVYNPLDPGSNSDDPSDVRNALGGSPGKFWHTSFYVGYPQFGHLKKGAGLILDMGKQVRLSQMSVQFGSSCCADVTIEIGNSNTESSAALSSFTSVTGVTKASGNTTFTISDSKASGRYVLIWITSLPPLSGNDYEAQIYDVSIHGTAV